MPTKSLAQHRMMEGVAHDPKFARKVGIPQKVGKEFVAADSSSCAYTKYLDCVKRGDAVGMKRGLKG